MVNKEEDVYRNAQKRDLIEKWEVLSLCHLIGENVECFQWSKFCQALRSMKENFSVRRNKKYNKTTINDGKYEGFLCIKRLFFKSYVKWMNSYRMTALRGIYYMRIRKFDKNCLHSLPGFYGFVGKKTKKCRKKSIAFHVFSFS